MTNFFSPNEKQKLGPFISKINRNIIPTNLDDLKKNIKSPHEFAYILSQIDQEKAIFLFSTLSPHINLNKQNRDIMISALESVLEKSNSKLTTLTKLIQTPQIKAIDMIIPANEQTPLLR